MSEVLYIINFIIRNDMNRSPEQSGRQPEIPPIESALEAIDILLDGTSDPIKVTRQLIAYIGKIENSNDRRGFILRCHEAMDAIKSAQELIKDHSEYTALASHLGVLFRIVHEQYMSQIAVFQTPSPHMQEYVPED